MTPGQTSQEKSIESPPPASSMDMRRFIQAVSASAREFVTARQLADSYGLKTTLSIDRWIEAGLLPPFTSPVKSSNRGWAVGTLNAYFATKGELAALGDNRPGQALGDAGQVGRKNVGVMALRNRHGRMAQQQGHVEDRHAAQQHLGGKPVSKRMRAEKTDAAAAGG